MKFRPRGVTEIKAVRVFLCPVCVPAVWSPYTTTNSVQGFSQKYAACMHVFVPPVVKNWSLETSN